MMQQIAYQVDTPKVKYLMWLRELTASTLAQRWKCHPSTVSRVIRGKIKDERWLNKLAQALEVEITDIRRGMGERPPFFSPRTITK
jgi:hypothetical protein